MLSCATSSDSNDRADKKDSNALYWPNFKNMPDTVRKMGLSKRMEAAGDPNVNGGISMNNNKQQFAQPMARTRSLSVGNLETEGPTAPMESSPLISEGSTQIIEDSPCPIQSLRASPGTIRRRQANVGAGVDVADLKLPIKF
ncbi:hypothetical protein Q1695_009879 [Nippostrongylus brasiliensis]|nr:hypothetical protein Q1695_009879 [Nippostrongylus brasiliensis]